MNPQNPSFGTGSNLLGGSGALAQNMAAAAPALNQQSPASAGFTPGQQVNPYPALPPRNAMPGILPPPPQGAPPPGMAKPTMPKTEHELIIEALANHMKSMDELRHKMHDAVNPPPPAPPTGGAQ